MSSPTWGCSADKMSSPATLQMPELWVYSVSHAARLNIFVYCSCYPWHGSGAGEGRILPGSWLPRDSKKYLALNSRSSLVRRNLYPLPSPQPAHGAIRVSGLRITVESTSWSLFSKPFPSEISSFWETSLSGNHFRQKSNPQHSTQITNSLQSPSVGLQELPFGREVRKWSVSIWCSKSLAWGLCTDVRSHRLWGLASEYLLFIFFFPRD